MTMTNGDTPDLHRTVVRQIGDMPKVVGIAGIGTTTEVIVHAMTWWQIVAVRSMRVYIQVFLGLLAADGVGAIELAQPNQQWGQMHTIAVASLAPCAISLLQNLLEFLTLIDKKRPGWRA